MGGGGGGSDERRKTKTAALANSVSLPFSFSSERKNKKTPLVPLSHALTLLFSFSNPLLFLSSPSENKKKTPQGLYEQFRRVANLYFLLIAALSLTPVSPVSPVTNIVPLVFVIAASLAKEAFEDARRAKKDRQVSVFVRGTEERGEGSERGALLSRSRERDFSHPFSRCCSRARERDKTKTFRPAPFPSHHSKPLSLPLLPFLLK